MTLMIEHHQQAIEMSNQVLDAGSNPRVAELARGIIQEQQGEIDKMRSWLQRWGL
jgi:uncharacterized protein (DUF305 family)